MRPTSRRHALAALGAGAAALLVPGGRSSAAPAAALPPLGDDFLWGVAASGFQTEGQAPESNWTRFVATGTVEPYCDAVAFLDRYAEDVDRAAGLGARVYRISIEWARVQPTPGDWDQRAFGQYDAIVGAIAAAGMRPMLTLDHWVYPGWAADRGGWRDQGMVDSWIANARTVIERYTGYDPLWVTINEPVAYIGTERRIGALGPGQEPAMLDRLAQAHNAAYDIIHQHRPGALVTSNLGYVPGAETQVNQPFVDRIADKLDFLGVDYYFGPGSDHPAAATAGSAGMWELPLQTEGIYYALRHYARRFPGTPLYVVENGMPTENGAPRPDGYTRADHLRDTVYWLQQARADGMNVIGYNYWSITDNYEWGTYTPRFGLYTVDAVTDPTLTRRPTDAVQVFATLTRAGGVPADYRPSREPVPCSRVDPPDSCDEPVTEVPLS